MRREGEDFEAHLAATLSGIPAPRLSAGFESRLRSRIAGEVRAREPARPRRGVALVPRARVLLRSYFVAAGLASAAIVATTEVPASLPPGAWASIVLMLAISLSPLWVLARLRPGLLEMLLRTLR